jgi:hypothetical protein
MKKRVFLLLLLAAFCVMVGCEKTIHEVRSPAAPAAAQLALSR